MLNSKQRAELSKLANTIEPVFQVGKSGVTENLVKQVAEALRARELIKLSVLETSPLGPAEEAREIASAADAEIVRVIGRKIILYKPNEENPVIVL